MSKKTIIIIRIIFWVALFFILCFFAYFKIVPSGNISYAHDFSKPNYFIGKLFPMERVETNKIKGDPVYFFLNPPRRFERAKVSVKFKNTSDFPIMEIGLLNDKFSYNYDLKPLSNKIIDQLSLAWAASPKKDGITLFEREKKYGSVEKFLSDLPDKNEIALYNYRLKNNFFLGGYKPDDKNYKIDYKFRGPYQFYTYIKNEDLDYVFDFSDLNINADDDPVKIKVYSESGEIYSVHLEDKKQESGFKASVKIADLPEGVYRFSIIANDGIITESIIGAQGEFAIINKIWLSEGNKENLVLFTDSREISVKTSNPASIGKIKAGDDFLDIFDSYRQFSIKISANPAKIELPKNDITISGDGVFSFNEKGLLNPKLKNVGANLDINGEKINYVLANYNIPSDSAEWQIAEAEFDLTKAYSENGKYKFLISVPGLKVEEPAGGEVIIKEIKIDLSGTSLIKKFKKYHEKLF